jgi:hypothetical protein
MLAFYIINWDHRGGNRMVIEFTITVYKRQFSEQSEGLPDSAVYKRQFSEQSEDLPESFDYRRQFSEESEVIPDTFEYKRKVSEESEGLPESAVYKRAHSETPQSIPEVSAYSRQFSPEDIPQSSSYKRPYSAGAKPQQKENVTEKPESKSAWSEEQPSTPFVLQCYMLAFYIINWDHRGGNRMVIEFTITYVCNQYLSPLKL